MAPHQQGRGEMGRSESERTSVRQGTIYWAYAVFEGGGRGMYSEVRIDVGRAGNKVLFVNAPVRGRGVTYLDN